MSDQPMVNLNVSDISDAVKVIDFACDQGAYRGWETIRQVQAVRDRLDLFVTAAAAITSESDTPAETETTGALFETDETDPDFAPADTVASQLPQRRQRRRVSR